MATIMPYDEAQRIEDLNAQIREMSEEQLLSIWEQSQRIFLALQNAVPATERFMSIGDDRIAMELLRRSLAHGHKVPGHIAPVPRRGVRAGR